jgi:hypothetical protein
VRVINAAWAAVFAHPSPCGNGLADARVIAYFLFLAAESALALIALINGS